MVQDSSDTLSLWHAFHSAGLSFKINMEYCFRNDILLWQVPLKLTKEKDKKDDKQLRKKQALKGTWQRGITVLLGMQKFG